MSLRSHGYKNLQTYHTGVLRIENRNAASCLQRANACTHVEKTYTAGREESGMKKMFEGWQRVIIGNDEKLEL